MSFTPLFLVQESPTFDAVNEMCDCSSLPPVVPCVLMLLSQGQFLLSPVGQTQYLKQENHYEMGPAIALIAYDKKPTWE